VYFKYVLIVDEENQYIVELKNVARIQINSRFEKISDILNIKIKDTVEAFDSNCREFVKGTVHSFGNYLEFLFVKWVSTWPPSSSFKLACG